MAHDKNDSTTTPGAPIQLSQEQLIASIVAALQANAQTNPSQTVDINALASSIGDAVAAGIASQTRRKVTFGEFEAKRTAGRHKLTRKCFENGVLMDIDVLSNAEIDLLNTITHSGRYVNRLVEVVVIDTGADEVIDLRYNCKTIDQRFKLKGEAKDTLDMLKQIKSAQDEERAEQALEQESKETRRRQFGQGAATRAARTAAGLNA